MLAGQTIDLDPSLNRELALSHEASPVADLSQLSTVPTNWLADLEAMCRVVIPALSQNPFEKHIGENSTHPGKNELIHGLQIIYHRLKGSLDNQLGSLNETNRAKCITDLVDDIGACTQGFHNRVQSIVSSFSVPKNLKQLLTKVRYTLVVETVHDLKNTIALGLQIHAPAEFSEIAAQHGLGVTKLRDDVHKSGLSKDIIIDALKHKFLEKYRVNNLPFLITEELNEIFSHFGYFGSLDPKDTDCNILFCSAIQVYLKSIFPGITDIDLEQQKLFVIVDNNGDCKTPLSPEDCIERAIDPDSGFSPGMKDINWQYLRKLIYQKIVEPNYVTTNTPSIFADFTNLYYLDLDPDKSAILFLSVEMLKNNTNSDSLINQLSKIKKAYPDYYEALVNMLRENTSEEIAKFKADIFQKVNFNKKIAAFLNTPSAATDKKAKYNELVSALELLLEFLNDSQRQIVLESLQQKDSLGFNVIRHTALHKFSLKPFLKFLTPCINRALVDSLFTQTSTTGFGILMFAASYIGIDELSYLLDFISQHHIHFGWDTIQNLIRQAIDKNVSLCNENHTHKNSAAIAPLLAFVTSHGNDLGEAFVKEMFDQIKELMTRFPVLTNDFNIALEPMIALTKKHAAFFTKTQLDSIAGFALTNKITAFLNTPSAATDKKAKYNELVSALELPLEFLNNSQRQTVLKSLEQKDSLGFNAIMHSINYKFNLKPFLKFLTPCINRELVDSLFTQTSTDGWGILMLAAYTGIDELSYLLEFISQHQIHFGWDTIRKLIGQAIAKNISLYNENHANKNPAAIAPLLAFVTLHGNDLGEAFVKDIFIQIKELMTRFPVLTNDFNIALEPMMALTKKHAAFFAAAFFTKAQLDSMVGFALTNKITAFLNTPSAATDKKAKYNELVSALELPLEFLNNSQRQTVLKSLEQKDSLGFNAIMHTALHKFSLKPFLKFLTPCINRALVDSLFTQTSTTGFGILMFAASYIGIDELSYLLEFISQHQIHFGWDTIRKLIGQAIAKNISLYNENHANKNPAAIAPLLAFVTLHGNDLGEAFVKDIFIQIKELMTRSSDLTDDFKIALAPMFTLTETHPAFFTEAQLDSMAASTQFYFGSKLETNKVDADAIVNAISSVNNLLEKDNLSTVFLDSLRKNIDKLSPQAVSGIYDSLRSNSVTKVAKTKTKEPIPQEKLSAFIKVKLIELIRKNPNATPDATSGKEMRVIVNLARENLGRDKFHQIYIEAINSLRSEESPALTVENALAWLKQGCLKTSFQGYYFNQHRGIGFFNTKSVNALTGEITRLEKEPLINRVAMTA